MAGKGKAQKGRHGRHHVLYMSWMTCYLVCPTQIRCNACSMSYVQCTCSSDVMYIACPI